jgi:D-alanyl-D-alanine carboxypeptidase
MAIAKNAEPDKGPYRVVQEQVNNERTVAVKNPLDPAELNTAIDRVHRAGMPGVFAEVHDGDQVWRGAAGVADVSTGRPVTPDMRHRVGSIAKTFTAAAVLQQVENGQIGLDTSISHYLPRLVPGERGDTITVRMLINHTSGLAEYLPYAYPSLKPFPRLADTTPKSLDDHRFTQFHRTELIEMGVRAPAVGMPGGTPGIYSNTNYQLLCQLLEHVTGATAETCITQNVIERSGLRDTELPAGPHVRGPHSQLYESWFGMIDPPRDYSVFDMSWVGPAASLISTVADLNRFYGLLLAGEIVNGSSLADMQRTVPVISQEGKKITYGLGLHRLEVPGHGTFWGHDGTVWGGGAISVTRADGKRQMSVAFNLIRWNKLDSSGKPQHHPIDDALAALYQLAMCGSGSLAIPNLT